MTRAAPPRPHAAPSSATRTRTATERGERRAARRFARTLAGDAARCAIAEALPGEELLALHHGLVRARLTDGVLTRLVRTGALSKAWLATGEEACAVGPARALRRGGDADARGIATTGDVIAPVIRNAGACFEFGMPIADVLRAYLGTADSSSGGRDGHYGAPALGVLPPVSHLGTMVPVVAGVALAFRLRAEPRVALGWIGDGTAKTSAAHEGLELAVRSCVPAIFILQNNQVALGTPLARHHLPTPHARAGLGGPSSAFASWPAAYGGAWGAVFDGNNVLDAYAATRLAAERCRAGAGPALLVAETFRMGGHATHDEAEARGVLPAALYEQWGPRDPIAGYEAYLRRERGIDARALRASAEGAAAAVERAEREALESWRDRMPAASSALHGVLAAP